MKGRDWVDEQLEDPEFRKHFFEELSRQHREEIETLRADRRRVAEKVAEAICNVIDAAADVEIVVTCDELLDQIRALDLDKLLEEE